MGDIPIFRSDETADGPPPDQLDPFELPDTPFYRQLKWFYTLQERQQDAAAAAATATDRMRFAFGSENPVLSNSLSAVIVGMTGISVSDARDYVNEWAYTWHSSLGRWPTGEEAMTDPGFTLGALKIPTFANLLPPMFIVSGPEGPVIYDNSVFTGPVPIEIPTTETPLAQWVNSTFLQAKGIEDPAELNFLLGNRGGVRPGTGGELALPIVSAEDLQAIRDRYTSLSQPTGGSGRGVRFDRAAVIESLRRQWQSILLIQPADPGALADQYIREATSFYAQGGSLDLDTWARGKMRETPRYKTLYGKLPGHMTEEEYAGGYQSTIGQFGLRPETERAETEIGMTSGVGQADFTRRVAGTREYQVGNLGALSRQFASMFQGLGSVARS